MRIEGLDHVNPEYLKTVATIRPGDTADINAISEDAGRMSALKDLESVGYRLEGDPNAATLVWLPQEVSIGTNVVRPSMGLFADGGGDLKFVLGVQHVRNWLNDRGGQWRNNLQIGYESHDLDEPVPAVRRSPSDSSSSPACSWAGPSRMIYADGDNIATYHFVDYGGRVDLGWNISRSAQLRVGYGAVKREIDLQTGTPLLPEDRIHGCRAHGFRDATIRGMPRLLRPAASPPRSITG